MYSEIDNLADRAEENLEESGSDILLKWNEWPSGMTRDRVTEKPSVPAEAKSEYLKAFLYYISASSVVRQFAEIEVGDCIVDFSATVDLTNRNDLVVVINGEEWVTKPVSGKLKQAWTDGQRNTGLYQTILLRKAT